MEELTFDWSIWNATEPTEEMVNTITPNRKTSNPFPFPFPTIDLGGNTFTNDIEKPPLRITRLQYYDYVLKREETLEGNSASNLFQTISNKTFDVTMEILPTTTRILVGLFHIDDQLTRPDEKSKLILITSTNEEHLICSNFMSGEIVVHLDNYACGSPINGVITFKLRAQITNLSKQGKKNGTPFTMKFAANKDNWADNPNPNGKVTFHVNSRPQQVRGRHVKEQQLQSQPSPPPVAPNHKDKKQRLEMGFSVSSTQDQMAKLMIHQNTSDPGIQVTHVIPPIEQSNIRLKTESSMPAMPPIVSISHTPHPLPTMITPASIALNTAVKLESLFGPTTTAPTTHHTSFGSPIQPTQATPSSSQSNPDSDPMSDELSSLNFSPGNVLTIPQDFQSMLAEFEKTFAVRDFMRIEEVTQKLAFQFAPNEISAFIEILDAFDTTRVTAASYEIFVKFFGTQSRDSWLEYLRAISGLLNKPWFHGIVLRDDHLDNEIQTNPDNGAFYVRFSTSEPSSIAYVWYDEPTRVVKRIKLKYENGRWEKKYKDILMFLELIIKKSLPNRGVGLPIKSSYTTESSSPYSTSPPSED